MTTEDKRRKPASEKVLKALEEGRLKGLETRRMKSELKKKSKEEERQALKKAYEEKVLKKKPVEPKETIEDIETTDKEIYPVKHKAKSDDESDSDDENVVVPKPKRKAKGKTKTNADVMEQPNQPNYKQEYYRAKLEKIRQQDQQQQFIHNYSQAPPQIHAHDIARTQLKNKIDSEVMARVYKDLFG